jgi:uncharacterized protein
MHRPKPNRPLSDAEIDELDRFLLYADVEDSMTLDMLDGYLHALAVGPTRPTPQEWLPRIWSEDHKDMMPPTRDAGEARRMVDLVQRLYRSIVQRLEDPRGASMAPLWSSFEDAGEERDDAQIWACGFLDGLELCRDDWQPLLDTPEGQAWLRPLRLLGEQAPGAEHEDLSATAAAREKLSHEIPDAVLSMHEYWRASRRAEAELADEPPSDSTR